MSSRVASGGVKGLVRTVRVVKLGVDKYDELVAAMPAICRFRFLGEDVPEEHTAICRKSNTADDANILVVVTP